MAFDLVVADKVSGQDQLLLLLPPIKNELTDTSP